MRPICKAIPFLFLVATPSFAGDNTLQVCVAGGYFSGAQDRFMSGLATHILEKKGILGTESCNAAWKDAYEVGVSFSKSGKVANSSEAAVIKRAAEFNIKVYSAIAKSMEP